MKTRIYLFLLILFPGLTSCSLEDPIKSEVTDHAKFQMTDGPYVYWPLGTEFTDPGISATSGEEEIEVSTEGTVDTDTPGVYVLKYSAENSDGFAASVERFVAVGNKEVAISRDLTGTYSPTNEVKKIVDGFYMNSDILPTNGIKVVMADLGNGELIIPPQSSKFGIVYADPQINENTGGILNEDGSFTIKQMLVAYGIYTRTFIKQ